MKALSIRQPWAWLIVNGYKTVENRTWKTNYRGQFLVHASKTFDLLPGEMTRLRRIMKKNLKLNCLSPSPTGALSALLRSWTA